MNPPPGNELTRAQAQRHFESYLAALGLDVRDAELKGTPARVAEMMEKLLAGHDPANAPKLTPIANADPSAGLVLVRDLPFYSLCVHHVLPFFGVAHIGYLPSDRLAGLGDLVKVVTYFSNRLTVQERLTTDVAQYIERGLAARGVAVLLEGRHLCLEMRGQEKEAFFETSAFRGELAEEKRRFEFLSRIRRDGAA
ncbi:MAG TPA: GTP cyclohydrolase I [Candidatus Eisenbacteria bacterium]|nr:GTP cyclohydrolase I [Candidatus Eisenbacteria bacterium]